MQFLIMIKKNFKIEYQLTRGIMKIYLVIGLLVFVSFLNLIQAFKPRENNAPNEIQKQNVSNSSPLSTKKIIGYYTEWSIYQPPPLNRRI